MDKERLHHIRHISILVDLHFMCDYSLLTYHSFCMIVYLMYCFVSLIQAVERGQCFFLDRSSLVSIRKQDSKQSLLLLLL